MKHLEGGPLCFGGPPGPRGLHHPLHRPPPRFKQLLLTQADKFSLAEVRVAGSLLGCSPQRALEASVIPAFLGLEPRLLEEGTVCQAGEPAVQRPSGTTVSAGWGCGVYPLPSFPIDNGKTVPWSWGSGLNS